MKPSFHASVSVNPTHYGSGETLERKVPESQDKHRTDLSSGSTWGE